MIYFTSDTHFCHQNILKFQPKERPFDNVDEMNESIIKTWNNVVKHTDSVYHLGDVSMGHHKEARNLIRRLNGRLYLIRGNHDHFSNRDEAEIFDAVYDYTVLKYEKERFVLFHFPIQQWDRCYYGDMHLHGHCHGNLKDIKPNRFDMGWDVFQRPVSIEEVKSWRVKEHEPHHGVIKERKL